MRTPLEALTEIRRRIQAKREWYRFKVEESRGNGHPEDTSFYNERSTSMSEALAIIDAVEQGR